MKKSSRRRGTIAAMGDVPERFRHLDGRLGLVSMGHLSIRAARRAIRRSLPTMDHAVRVFDSAVALLGARAWIDPEGGEHRRRLYVRDVTRPEWLVAQSLMEHAWTSGVSAVHAMTMVNSDPVTPADAPSGWKFGDPWFESVDRKPDIVPRGKSMRAGRLAIQCGPTNIELSYDERGVFRESCSTAGDMFTIARYDGVRPFAIDPTARPPHLAPIAILCRDDLAEEGVSIDAFARMVLDLDIGTIPARVRLPVPVPGGAESVWNCAREGLRRAIWNQTLPADARWAIADGFVGTAVAWADTPDDAWERWQAALFRVKPRPPGSAPSDTAIGTERDIPYEPPRTWESDSGNAKAVSTGTIVLHGPAGGDIPWPAAVPSRTPAGMLELPPMPETISPEFAAAGFARWIRVLRAWGDVRHALVREEPDGWTLVGDGVLDLVTPATIGDEIDACEKARRDDYADHPPEWRTWEDPRYRSAIVQFGCWNSDRQCAAPLKITNECWSPEFNAGSVQWETLPWGVARVRRVR